MDRTSAPSCPKGGGRRAAVSSWPIGPCLLGSGATSGWRRPAKVRLPGRPPWPSRRDRTWTAAPRQHPHGDWNPGHRRHAHEMTRTSAGRGGRAHRGTGLVLGVLLLASRSASRSRGPRSARLGQPRRQDPHELRRRRRPHLRSRVRQVVVHMVCLARRLRAAGVARGRVASGPRRPWTPRTRVDAQAADTSGW